MGRILRFKRRVSSPIATVAEGLAHLEEELTLTVAYTRAMVRDDSYRAALGVVEEQRARLASAFGAFEHGPLATARRRHRTKVLASGLAAAALVGSAAFAGFGPVGGPARGAPKVIREAQRTLDAARYLRDPQSLEMLVGKVHRDLATLKSRDLTDPERNQVLDLLNVERDLISSVPRLSQELMRQVEVLVDQIKPPEPEPEPAPQQQQAPTPAQPEAPPQAGA